MTVAYRPPVIGRPAGQRYASYCDAMETEIGRFVGAVEVAGFDTPVPTCPGWTVGRLVRHVGTTHRWVEHIVRHRVQQRMSSRDVVADVPDDEAGYLAWLGSGAERLVGLLRGTDPDTPLWNVLGTAHRAAFWPRRMLHEALIHRADAELALGGDPKIDTDLAVDGIDEILTHLPGASWVADRIRALGPADQRIQFACADAAWLVRLGSDGCTVARRLGPATVAVRAAVSDLLLVAYGRLGPRDRRLEVLGDRGLLESWTAATAF